jgi:DNA polymerase-3 subunit epsilon
VISRDRLADTLLLARRKHPGVSNRLDELYSRHSIDNSRRTRHGALLDAELLAEVYIDLIGARQSRLILASETRESRAQRTGDTPRRQRETTLTPRITDSPDCEARLYRHAARHADLERLCRLKRHHRRLAAKCLY